MDNSIDDCFDELVMSEKLNSFSVIEKFCEQCGDMSPHHIEDELSNNFKKLASGVSEVAPMSLIECVYCREEQEQSLDSLH